MQQGYAELKTGLEHRHGLHVVRANLSDAEFVNGADPPIRDAEPSRSSGRPHSLPVQQDDLYRRRPCRIHFPPDRWRGTNLQVL